MNNTTIAVIQHPTNADEYGVIGTFQPMRKLFPGIGEPLNNELLVKWLSTEDCDAAEARAEVIGLTLLTDGEVG